MDLFVIEENENSVIQRLLREAASFITDRSSQVCQQKYLQTKMAVKKIRFVYDRRLDDDFVGGLIRYGPILFSECAHNISLP